jgi:hypothetical protein
MLLIKMLYLMLLSKHITNLRFVELNNSHTPSPSTSPPTECEDSPLQMKFGKKKRACGWVLKKKINGVKKGVSQQSTLFFGM